MNPLLVLLVLNMLDQKKHRRYTSPYFDTFKMEMLLDKLQGTVNALDKVNRLNQIMREPHSLKAPAHAAPSGTSADADSDALPSSSSLPATLDLGGLGQLAPLLGQLGGIGDIKNLANNLGPIINMLSSVQNSQEK